MNMNKKVFFIGDVALDEYYTAPYFPKIKEKIIVHTLPVQMGGMIANAACVYASFGANVSFLTALNSGYNSQNLCEGLRAVGIDTTHMVWDDTLPDAKTIVILAEDEHTVFIPTMGLQKMEISDAAFKALCESDYLYTNFCEISPICYKGHYASEVLSMIKEQGCKIWCDLDVAEINDSEEFLLNFVDTLFLNEKGYENLSKRANEDAISWLHKKGIRTIIVTEAENGCSIYPAGQNKISINGITVPVVDVTGAGDTFCSIFLYASTKSDDVVLCAEFANYAAAHAVTGMGARFGAVGVDKVLAFIAAHGGNPENYMMMK